MEKKLDLILDQLQTMNQRIGGIELEQQQVKSQLDNIGSEQLLIKSQLDENTQLTRVIYNRQVETDARLEAVEMEVHHLRGDVTYLKEGESLHDESFQQFEDSQNRHERILERLSLRSIEQEADIVSLRYII